MRRAGKDVFYHNKNFECDFILRDGNKITEAIQICYNLSSEDVKKREIQGLIDALQFYELKEGTIITMNDEQEFTKKSKTIKIIPAWKWILKEK